MIKKYQVFVSSTYEDLKEERFEIMQTLLKLECIPSGMELFPASNEAQWNVIKKVIDDCDYYIVIIGGKYGSTNKDGISFTEMEYDYATEIGKVVLPFLIRDPSKLPGFKMEFDFERNNRLKDFRQKIQNKLCLFWQTSADLAACVSTTLHVEIQKNPGIGWVRANELLSTAEQKTFKSVGSVGLTKVWDNLGNFGNQAEWIDLIENAKTHVDIQGRTLFGWTKSNHIEEIINRKVVKEGVHFRWLLMHENNVYINNLTEENHGIGDMLKQKIEVTKKFLLRIQNKIPKKLKKKFEIHFFSNVPLYCSILRVDEDFFIHNYLYSAGSNDSPMIHLHGIQKPWSKLYKAEFDLLWKNSGQTT